ncbi:hypothetical protein OK015_11895 [Mycobacterium sp. Aquia_216]|uniref:hypothetical protein n=1 Tax=Mycobacterium sp. Aquia_216 TaxID=2991729 RepID=UPI00227D31E8|nr:hypothetical protein [Mycobacterium sp. Aquia_216]WAJ47084.1 hypothetical protein OK015_11895 [Mycobacterium sp. Aquia_216]
MVNKVSVAAAGLVATTLVVGVAVTGCGGDKSSGPSSSSKSSTSTSSATSSSSAAPTSSSGAAQPSDYSNLLIKAADIVVPGDSFNPPKTRPLTDPAPGIEGVFANQAGSRSIVDSLLVYPDPGAADKDRDSLTKSYIDPQNGAIKGAAPAPADVGVGGTIISGPSADGAKAKTSVIFGEGKVVALIEFESAPNDLVPADIVLDVARKQDAAIKAGLPS